MALNLNLPNTTVAEAHAKVVIENNKVILKVSEKVQTPFGPIDGPPLNIELDPMDVLHIATNGISGIVKNLLGKK